MPHGTSKLTMGKKVV
jgi:hypothetical protein